MESLSDVLMRSLNYSCDNIYFKNHSKVFSADKCFYFSMKSSELLRVVFSYAYLVFSYAYLVYSQPPACLHQAM